MNLICLKCLEGGILHSNYFNDFVDIDYSVSGSLFNLHKVIIKDEDYYDH